MQPLRAPRATIVPVPALVDRKAGVVPKVDVAPKADAVLKTGAVVPDDVRSRAWSSLSVRWFPAARLTRRGSRLQAFRFGRLRLQNHVTALVAKAPVDQAVRVDPVDQPALAAVRLRVVIANFATRANRGRHTSKFFTSRACFSM